MDYIKITIIKTQTPQGHNINDLLRWFGASLGLFNVRDKDSSCFRIFVSLVRDLQAGSNGISSDDMAELTGLTRGTVVHHLNKLIDTGIVITSGNRYYLKVSSLEELVEEIKNNLINTFDSLSTIASRLDSQLGLKK